MQEKLRLDLPKLELITIHFRAMMGESKYRKGGNWGEKSYKPTTLIMKSRSNNTI